MPYDSSGTSGSPVTTTAATNSHHIVVTNNTAVPLRIIATTNALRVQSALQVAPKSSSGWLNVVAWTGLVAFVVGVPLAYVWDSPVSTGLVPIGLGLFALAGSLTTR